MTAILVKVFFASGIFLLAIYYGTRYLAGKVHPTEEQKQVTQEVHQDFHKQVEEELFNVEEREVVKEPKKESKSEFPIDKPKKKRKYYPKKKQ